MADFDYNALGQAIDTTWGRSSTPRTATQSVKLTMQGPDQLVATYAAVVNFASDKQRIEMKRAYEEESRSIISATLKTVKANYKDLAGESLTTKELSSSDNLEIIGSNVYNPRRTAYYRRRTVFQVG